MAGTKNNQPIYDWTSFTFTLSREVANFSEDIGLPADFLINVISLAKFKYPRSVFSEGI
jgi:hypothetical protein